jgi:hypothetical protein
VRRGLKAVLGVAATSIALTVGSSVAFADENLNVDVPGLQVPTSVASIGQAVDETVNTPVGDIIDGVNYISGSNTLSPSYVNVSSNGTQIFHIDPPRPLFSR